MVNTHEADVLDENRGAIMAEPSLHNGTSEKRKFPVTETTSSLELRRRETLEISGGRIDERTMDVGTTLPM